VPYIGVSGELKTKPTQHSVQKLREIGIQPDFLLCRTDRELESDIKSKIALFCNIKTENVITAKDVKNIYEVPLHLHQEGLDEKICKKLNLKSKSKGLTKWKQIAEVMASPKYGEVNIGIVGKYVDLKESYKSVTEALIHGSIENQCRLNLHYIDSEFLEKDTYYEKTLSGLDGILVPGGFGNRGVEGKIKAIEFARTQKIPYMGICIGMQLAIIEYARHLCGIQKATSREFSNTGEFVIDLMEDQWKKDKVGATMRLGAYDCQLAPTSLAQQTYKKNKIVERHRHRYEVNPHYIKILQDRGMLFSGINPETKLIEMMELKDHPWFLTCQFHPEFKSKPFLPHPMFSGFVKASLTKMFEKIKNKNTKESKSSGKGILVKRSRHNKIQATII
jgi:CTP synthase